METTLVVFLEKIRVHMPGESHNSSSTTVYTTSAITHHTLISSTPLTMKDVSSRAVMHQRSSHVEKMQFNVFVNEVLRILRNCSQHTAWKEEALKKSHSECLENSKIFKILPFWPNFCLFVSFYPLIFQKWLQISLHFFNFFEFWLFPGNQSYCVLLLLMFANINFRGY